MKRILLILLIVITSKAYTQRTFAVAGSVVDSSGSPLQGASVRIMGAGKQYAGIKESDEKGLFRIDQISTDSFTIIIDYVGAQSFKQVYHKTGDSTVFNVPKIILQWLPGQMGEIVIRSVNSIIIKEDTIQYAASSYQVKEGDAVEEVIKKLPGVEIDEEGGVQAHGKKISRIRVNGKDFVGDDLDAALKGLPADIVDNIQVIDDYGDQANFTGIKSGEPTKIININIKKSKNYGSTSSFSAGIGSAQRFGLNANINNFKGPRRLTFIGTINNTNINTSNLGRISGGNGITTTKSATVNYDNKLSEQLTVYGSYTYSNTNNNSKNTTFSQNFDPLNIRTSYKESANKSLNNSHRLNWNMEYAISSVDRIKLSPSFTHTNLNNESISSQDIQKPLYSTKSQRMNTGSGSSSNLALNLLYSHKFKKNGRTFSVSASISDSKNEKNMFNNTFYQNYDSSGGATTHRKDTLQIQNSNDKTPNSSNNVGVSYVEPLDSAKTTFIELKYDRNNNISENTKEAYDWLDSTGQERRFSENQSNSYTSGFTKNRASINLRGKKTKYNYVIGVQYEPNTLKGTGNSIKRTYNTTYKSRNWVPSARFVYTFSKGNVLTASVNGSAREPGINQIQPVTDSSNLENILVGNPDLKNEFTNKFNLSYNRSFGMMDHMLNMSLTYNVTNDKIVYSRTNNHTGTGSSTGYFNTDGFYGYETEASYSRPFTAPGSKTKFTATVRMSAQYSNNPSFTDGQKGTGYNWRAAPNLRLSLNIKNRMDLSLNSSFSHNQTLTKYSLAYSETKSDMISLNLTGRNFFGDLTISYDVKKSMSYYSNRKKVDIPASIGFYAEYKLIKKYNLNIKLQANDVFDDYTGIERKVSGTTVSDIRNSRIGRFFLLSANMRINKYAGKISSGKNQRRR